MATRTHGHAQELLARYNFSEIWFDGGAPCLSSYENAIANLTSFYQRSRAVAFQGPTSYPNNVRWVGTESGVAPTETWSAAASSQVRADARTHARTHARTRARTHARTGVRCGAARWGGMGAC